MPAKPAWYSKIDEIIGALETSPRPFIDRGTVEFLLGVGRRRAQQIMAPCITDRVGASGLADRDALIARLRNIRAGDDGVYEARRRQRLATLVEEWRKERLEQPAVLVEAPLNVVNQRIEGLPAGVRLERGRIVVEFDAPHEGLQKLLALAMAIRNDELLFERLATGKR